MSEIDGELEGYLKLDKDLVEIASEFRILSLIEWPKETQEQFIANYRKGEKKLPSIVYPRHEFKDALKGLDAIMAQTDTGHPIAAFLHDTAKSYWLGYKLAENLGRKEMLDYSLQIYGKPGDPVAGTKYTNFNAAEFFVTLSDEMNEYFDIGEQDICVLAETIKSQLEEEIKKVITDDTVNVFIDENLVPKAAAGATRIRLRSGTCFSPFDFKQLLEHEVYVHSLTALNGRHQRQLTALSLGAPRTTATQEGLATFAELITGAIDLMRLKRLALRVIGIDMALKGANFVEVYEFFRSKNQSESESYSSAQRIFRGGDPNGGTVFTKDNVYLDGILRAHSYFRWAMKNHKLNLSYVLFAGRMTFDDAERLAPFVETGVIQSPKYLPPWLAQIPTLGAYLAFSLFANKIRVGGLDKEFGQNEKS